MKVCASSVWHKGPYDDEPATIAKMNLYETSSEYKNAIGSNNALGNCHHEIYLVIQETKLEAIRTVPGTR